MNTTFLLQTFLRINALHPFPELPRQVLHLLGHSIIISPNVFHMLSKVDFPHILATYGDLVEGEVTGAVIAGNGKTLQEQIGFLSAQTGWMARAVVVVLANRPGKNTFAYLWRRKVINVICFTGKQLFTYNPFNDTIIELDKDDIEEKMYTRWRDLEGYRISVAKLKQDANSKEENVHLLNEGIDEIAILELAKHWNVTLNLKNIKYSDSTSLQSSQMVIKTLKND